MRRTAIPESGKVSIESVKLGGGAVGEGVCASVDATNAKPIVTQANILTLRFTI
jgi:hypothetical protein